MSGLENSASTNIQRAGRLSSISASSSSSNANSRQTATSEEDLKKAMKFARMGLMSRQSCAFYEQYANNDANGSSIPKPLINLDDIDDDSSSVGSFSGKIGEDGAGLNNTTIHNSSTPGSAFNKYLPPQTKAPKNIAEPNFTANSSLVDANTSPTQVDDFQDTTDTEIIRPRRNRRSSVKNIQMNMKRQSLSDAEIRSASKGIMSNKSLLLYDQEQQQQQILDGLELSDEENNEYSEVLPATTLITIYSGEEVNHPRPPKSTQSSINLQKDRSMRKLVTILIVVVLMMSWTFLVMAIASSLSGGRVSADVKGYAFVPSTLDLPEREMQRLTPEANSAIALTDNPAVDNNDDSRGKQQIDERLQLEDIESKLKPLKEYYTGVEFPPKVDGLYLVGAGVRKKSIIKVYSVAMYSSPTVLVNAVTSKALGTAARTFDTSTPVTFLLEMVYSVGAEKIASAIAESVRPRYGGSPSDINALESLIIAGVNDIGGQAVKGTVFRFDCSADGVAVTVNGAMQGTASFKDLGSAFVDVFVDENAVSPTLVDSCVDTWSTKEAQIMASNLLESSQIEAVGTLEGQAVNETSPEAESHEPEVHDKIARLETIESSLKPMKEYYTSLEFAPKLGKGLYLVGAGVRKKSIIKVYSVAMYSSPTVLVNAVTSKALGTAARKFDSLSPTTTFILKMVYSVGAEKIASAIAESVRPRYGGLPSDINALESLIIAGVNKIGGQAVQGTVFRFDCSDDGVGVIVGGTLQGMANFKGLGSAFVDVFMDENAVSPTLVDNCLNSWSGEEAKSIAASLFEFSQAETMGTFDDLPTAYDGSLEIESKELKASDEAAVNTDLVGNDETLKPQAELDIYLNSYSIDQIAAIRARNSRLAIKETMLNAIQSVQDGSSIQSQASDRAAKKLHHLASTISKDDSVAGDRGKKDVKNVLRVLFQVLF